MSSRRNLAVRTVLILLALLLPACLGPGRRGVGVKSLAADLVFGIPPLEEEVAPPDVVPAEIEVRDLGDNNPAPLRRAIPSAPAAEECPDPEVNEVEAEAGDKISGGLPLAGTYRWKMSGYQTYPPPLGRFPLPDFDARAIDKVKPLQSQGDHTFRTAQVEVGSGTTVAHTFEVITSRPDARAGPNVVRDQGQLNGVFLTRIERQGSDGKSVTFNANPPVLYLPIPVTVGYKLTSESTDPVSLQTMTHTVSVRGRSRYQACGALVDSWLVDGEQTFSGRDVNGKRDYNYGIATQMGGIIVYEHAEAPCATVDTNTGRCNPEGNVFYDSNIGSLKPEEE